MNILWSILWIILLILFIWWLSGTVASIYILLLPFVACIPALAPVTDFLLKIVQFPAKVGEYIRDGSSGILGEYKEIP